VFVRLTAIAIVGILSLLFYQTLTYHSSSSLGLQAASAGAAADSAVIIPVYNQKGLKTVQADLGNYIRPDDTFLLISGNNGNPLSVAWLNSAAASLALQFPDNKIVAGTAGLDNVRILAEGATGAIESIVYIYEPNMANEPEFTWDFSETIANVDEAANAARAHGFDIVVKPTGRPLLQAYLFKHGWDYSTLGGRVDENYIQTQTYCAKSPQTFDEAAEKLTSQYGGASSDWSMEVTIDPGAPNGVSVPQALACLQAAESRGVANFMMWWTPAYPELAADFLQAWDVLPKSWL
jgi:hypothetical protein